MPSSKEMLAAAHAVVPKISAQETAAMMASGKAVVVDVRDGTEVQSTGKVKGALHVSRGVLEFRADPASESYDKKLDPEKTVILYCGGGGRAALAGKVLKELGYKDVRNLGGFKDWTAFGGEVDKG